MGKIVYVHTSGRSSFLRCRRRWDFSDNNRQNLEPREKPAPFFLGSAFHFALEDLHGYKRYDSGADAILAFAYAQIDSKCPVPDDWEEHVALAQGMMRHYDTWLQTRPGITLHEVDGVLQTEVTFAIDLTPQLGHLPLKEWGIDQVIYRGTFDGIAIDSHGQLWIIEYKTAKQFQLRHFETDRQISSYCWAASCLYDRPIAGVVYQQHKKQVPDSPRLLANGTYSTSASQNCVYQDYYDALKNMYGDVKKAPKGNIKCMNELCMKESEINDGYVKRDIVKRNPHQLEAEGSKIIQEMSDFLNPNLEIYPNPTKDCSWDCSFNNSCVLMDAGYDWEGEIDLIYQPRTSEELTWRKKLLSKQQLSQRQNHPLKSNQPLTSSDFLK